MRYRFSGLVLTLALACQPALAGTSFHEEEALLSFDLIGEDDPGGQDLKGGRFGLGQWTDSAEMFGIRHLASLSYASGDEQRVIRAEGNAGLIVLIAGPFRAVPMFGAGVEYRGQDPDAGLAFLLNIGFEAAFWVHDKWQVAAAIQRNFGFPSGTRNELVFSLRYSPRRLPWWPKPATPAEPATTGSQE